MVALQELKDTLLRLGLKPGMKLMVHSKFSSFGGVEGGPEAFCRLLMDILTPEGTLMMPSFTFGIYEGKTYGQPFDYLNTPSDTGIVTEFFRKMPGVCRSADPCHATSVWGKDAWLYVKDHHKIPTVAPDGICRSIPESAKFCASAEYLKETPSKSIEPSATVPTGSSGFFMSGSSSRTSQIRLALSTEIVTITKIIENIISAISTCIP